MTTRPATRSAWSSAKRTIVCAPIEAPASTRALDPAVVEHGEQVGGEVVVAVGVGRGRRRGRAVPARVVGDHAVAVALERLGAHHDVAARRGQAVQQDDRRSPPAPRRRASVTPPASIGHARSHGSAYPGAMIFDVDRGDFETEVVERSRELPVVVDFWAAWCGPCRQLTPVLEKAVDQARGQGRAGQARHRRQPAGRRTRSASRASPPSRRSATARSSPSSSARSPRRRSSGSSTRWCPPRPTSSSRRRRGGPAARARARARPRRRRRPARAPAAARGEREEALGAARQRPRLLRRRGLAARLRLEDDEELAPRSRRSTRARSSAARRADRRDAASGTRTGATTCAAPSSACSTSSGSSTRSRATRAASSPPRCTSASCTAHPGNPVDLRAVGVGPGDRLAVAGQHEAAVRPRVAGLGDRRAPLVADPDGADGTDGLGERGALGRIGHVGEHGRVGHDQRGVRRRLRGERGQVAAQVAAHQARRVLARDRDRRPQLRQPVALPGPDERLQPGHLLGVHDVDRLEVEPGTQAISGQRAGSGVPGLARQAKVGGVARGGRGMAVRGGHRSRRRSGRGAGTAPRRRRPPAARAAAAAWPAAAAASRSAPARWSACGGPARSSSSSSPRSPNQARNSSQPLGVPHSASIAENSRFGCCLARGRPARTSSSSRSRATPRASSA